MLTLRVITRLPASASRDSEIGNRRLSSQKQIQHRRQHGLRTLYFVNGSLAFGNYDDEFEADVVEIDLSLLNGCKSLHRVSMRTIDSGIADWLSGPARTVQELLVTNNYDSHDPDLDLFKKLKLKRLPMLYVDDHDDETLLPKSERAASESEISPDRLSVASEDKTVISVFDRVKVGHDLFHLQKLSFTMRFQTQWTHFLHDILPPLTNLQQLHIREQRSLLR